MNEKTTVDLPGYKGVDASLIAAILDAVHDIAQELAFMRNADIRGLDKLNKDYVESAFFYADSRIQDDLTDIMLKIRSMRTACDPAKKKSYRLLTSRYVRTSDTKE